MATDLSTDRESMATVTRGRLHALGLPVIDLDAKRLEQWGHVFAYLDAWDAVQRLWDGGRGDSPEADRLRAAMREHSVPLPFDLRIHKLRHIKAQSAARFGIDLGRAWSHEEMRCLYPDIWHVASRWGAARNVRVEIGMPMSGEDFRDNVVAVYVEWRTGKRYSTPIGHAVRIPGCEANPAVILAALAPIEPLIPPDARPDNNLLPDDAD